MKAQKIIAAIILCIIAQITLAAEQVNIYSYRKPKLIQPMLDVFTQDSQIKVNIVHAQKGMLERLKREGVNTPADVVLTVDIGRLTDLKQAGLTQPVQSDVLTSHVPKSQRDADNHWFGITQRARIIVASKDRVDQATLKTYEDLANENIVSRVCTRSGKHPYMVALAASKITHDGLAEAEKWLLGLKQNRARKPQGNDRAQVKAIKQGECDVAIINHYYMVNMLNDPQQVAWAKAVNVIFPNQQGRGTHVNISGMALTKHAKNKANAVKLMEFLASDKAQKMYSDINGEYPVQADIPASLLLQQWGEFKRDDIALDQVAANRREAIMLMDRIAFDE